MRTDLLLALWLAALHTRPGMARRWRSRARDSVLILGAVLMLGCTPAPTPVQPWGDSGDCAGACSVLRSLGCPESQPTPRGETCEAVCAGNLELLNVGCVVQAVSVSDVRICNVRCRQ